MISPEQMRKKSDAMEESQRHARYAQADGSMKKGNDSPYVSPGIAEAGRRVDAATEKETASIGPSDRSPNVDVRF